MARSLFAATELAVLRTARHVAMARARAATGMQSAFRRHHARHGYTTKRLAAVRVQVGELTDVYATEVVQRSVCFLLRACVIDCPVVRRTRTLRASLCCVSSHALHSIDGAATFYLQPTKPQLLLATKSCWLAGLLCRHGGEVCEREQSPRTNARYVGCLNTPQPLTRTQQPAHCTSSRMFWLWSSCASMCGSGRSHTRNGHGTRARNSCAKRQSMSSECSAVMWLADAPTFTGFSAKPNGKLLQLLESSQAGDV